jgi:hypothetical protein
MYHCCPSDNSQELWEKLELAAVKSNKFNIVLFLYIVRVIKSVLLRFQDVKIFFGHRIG